MSTSVEAYPFRDINGLLDMAHNGDPLPNGFSLCIETPAEFVRFDEGFDRAIDELEAGAPDNFYTNPALTLFGRSDFTSLMPTHRSGEVIRGVVDAYHQFSGEGFRREPVVAVNRMVLAGKGARDPSTGDVYVGTSVDKDRKFARKVVAFRSLIRETVTPGRRPSSDRVFTSISKFPGRHVNEALERYRHLYKLVETDRVNPCLSFSAQDVLVAKIPGLPPKVLLP